MQEFTYTEAYMLCVLQNQNRINALYNVPHSVCIAAAVISELLDDGVFALEGQKLVVSGALPEDKRALSPAFEAVSSFRRPRSLNKAISEVGSQKKVRKALVDGLMNQLIREGSVVMQGRDQTASSACRVSQAAMLADLTNAMRSSLLGDMQGNEPLTVLAALLQASQELSPFFSKEEWKQAKSNVKKLKKHAIVKPVMEAVNDLTAFWVPTIYHG